jgi:hypothetical protein
MIRYWSARYCSDTNHVKNLEDANYKTDLLTALKEAKQHLKDLLLHEGRRNFRVLDPNVDIQNLRESEAWGSDTIHPLSVVYMKMAEAVARILASMAGDRKRERVLGSWERARRRQEDACRPPWWAPSWRPKRLRLRARTGAWRTLC